MTIPVHCFWQAGPLPKLAHLALASFIRHAGLPILWSYDALTIDSAEAAYGDAVACRNANEIVSWDETVRYTFRTGQTALFGDRFAWEVLFKRGGWWAHLDLVLLKPLSALDHLYYVFGPHHRYIAGMPLWKAPVGSPALAQMLEAKVELPPRHWHAMMEVADKVIRDRNLSAHVRKDLHNDDGVDGELLDMMRAGSSLPPDWQHLHAIHWLGSGRPGHMAPEPDSYFMRLWDEYGAR